MECTKFNSFRHRCGYGTKNMKNGKSPGPENINLALIKKGWKKCFNTGNKIIK
jgi:hypothetical protein